jgi:hypothetical protein
LIPNFHGKGIGKPLPLDKKIGSKWSFHFMGEAIDTSEKSGTIL